MIHACEFSKEFKRKKNKAYQLRRFTGLRDKTIVMILLDTGIRVGELCRLEIKDVNLETGEVLVRPFGTGRKTRPRVVYLGKGTRCSLWLNLAKRKDDDLEQRLFPVLVTAIRSWMREMSERAQVANVHPRRFRHIFAIQYLRNGGDVFTLQRLLGYASLDMVQRYLALAEADVANAHKKASPVDRWKL